MIPILHLCFISPNLKLSYKKNCIYSNSSTKKFLANFVLYCFIAFRYFQLQILTR